MRIIIYILIGIIGMFALSISIATGVYAGMKLFKEKENG